MPGAVTCVVPPAANGLPRVVDVAVSNAPAGLRGATRGGGTFVYRESSIQASPGSSSAAVNASLALTRAAAAFGSAGGGSELQSYAVSLWVRPAAGTAGGDVLTFTTGGAHVVAVRYDGVGQFAYSDDAIGVVEAPTAAAAGEWHFIVLSVGADGRDK